MAVTARSERDEAIQNGISDWIASPALAMTKIEADRRRDYSAALTLIFAPPRTLPSAFTSPSAFAQMLQGLANRVSSPLEIGVRPNPMAMA